MYSEKDSPEVKAALRACMMASIAWAEEAGITGDRLPEPSTMPLPKELAWREAVAHRVAVGDETPEKADELTRSDYMFYIVTLRQLRRDMQRGCPYHQQVTMFCAGVFGELHLPFIHFMGMTHQEYLDFLLALHKEHRPDCPGFTATEAALGPDCVGPLRRDEVQEWT